MARILAIIMAGGVGERLKPLTAERSKAAVPFGGKFRLIDITLSNCINSGLRQIFVLTQYRSESLNRHIQDGWGISGSGLGDFIYSVPAQQKLGADWYRGTADAVRQNLNLVKNRNFDHVLILSGDHVYKMDYNQFIAYHLTRRASLTISAVRARKSQAVRRLGVLEIDDDYRLIGFEEKPENPKTLPGTPDYSLASMGIYIFKVDTLLEIMKGTEADFGKDIIPKMIPAYTNIYVYDYEKENAIEEIIIEVKNGIREKKLVDRTRDSSYWRDVGTIDSYYEASMDLVSVDPIFNLYGEKWQFRAYTPPRPPSKCIIGGRVMESLVSDGSIISGGIVCNSILSPGVIVERDALVEQSIIFDDVVIEPGAHIRRAIIDKTALIRAGTALGYNHEEDKRRDCTISDSGIVVVPKGAEIRHSESALL